MKSSDNGYNSHVESETLRPLCVVLVSAPHWFRLCYGSNHYILLLARCVRLVATWRSSREVDSVHWTPYKMKPDCRIFTFLILSFTLFQDTQGKFLRNSNTFDKIFFFYFRLLILNGEFHFNFFYRTPILIWNCYSIYLYILLDWKYVPVYVKKRRKQIIFVWSVQWW